MPMEPTIFIHLPNKFPQFTEHPVVYHSNLGFVWLGCNLCFHPILGCLGIQVAFREGTASFRGLNFVFFWCQLGQAIFDGEEYVALTELNL